MQRNTTCFYVREYFQELVMGHISSLQHLAPSLLAGMRMTLLTATDAGIEYFLAFLAVPIIHKATGQKYEPNPHTKHDTYFPILLTVSLRH